VVILLSLAQVALSQPRITGKVTSTDGLPLIGATISEKSILNAAMSGNDGNYLITVADKKAVLLFSYTGYESQETNIGDKTIIDVWLSPKNNNLDQVVVVGYGTQKKVNVIGAIS